MSESCLKPSATASLAISRLPTEGYRSRLSDFLNRADQSFIPLVNVEIGPNGSNGAGPVELHGFLAVARSHIQLAHPLDGE